MSEMKVPKGWELTTIGNEVEFVYGKNLPKPERIEGDYPVYGSNGIVGTHNEFLIDFPSIVIGRKGTVGALHKTHKKFWPTDVSFYTKILNPKKLDLDFLYYLLSYIDLQKIKQSGPKSGLNRNDAYKIPLMLPKIKTQKNIVAKLDSILGQLEEKKKEILSRIENFDANKINENYKNYLLKLAFDGTLTGEESEIIDGIKVPKGWELKKLGDPSISEIIMGQSPPGYTYNKNQNGMPFFQGKKDFGEKFPIPTVWCSEPKKIAKEGDILISVRAPVGSTNWAKEECCIGRGLSAIRVKIQPEYIYYFLKSLEQKLSKSGTGSVFNSIGRDYLHDLSIPLPPLETQKKIVKILDQKFADWESHKQELQNIQNQHELIKKHLNSLSSSILNDAFSGKLVN